MSIFRKYPSTRLRRLRKNLNLIELVSETNLTSKDLIQPIFIKENFEGKEQIESMPDIFRFGLNHVLSEIEELINVGINAIAVFPVIESSKKDEKGSEALNKSNFIAHSINKIKQEFPELILIADVALDPYTDHGHDGILINNEVANDETVEVLIEQSILLAEAGADIVAPSDMMDGRVGRIRQTLEKKEYYDTMIMSYAAKYSSSLYGPFREAVNAGKLIEPKNKKSYQMDIANIDEAMHEIAMDISEGADMIMIKPGLPYLDVISKAKELFSMPTFAYQVSGEYSMIMSAVEKNQLEELDTIFETMLCFKRAGADGIFTYFAPNLLNSLSNIS